MNISAVKRVCFSPTGTTNRVLHGIARGLGVDGIEDVDLTPPDAETRPLPAMGDAMVLIGAPVYGGRIPTVAERRLRRLQGGGAAAVVVAVYGNREYEDALLELRDLALQQGFVPVAGAAFLGEHSYSTAATPIAQGRPDAQDLEAAMSFGAAIRERLAGMASLGELGPLHVPGNMPYKARGARSEPMSPVTREELCIKCGRCAEVCPVAAVTVGETVTTDGLACILCCACTRVCPTDARVLDLPGINAWREGAVVRLRERKEPVTFVAAMKSR